DAIVPAAHRSRHSGLTGVLNTILRLAHCFFHDMRRVGRRIAHLALGSKPAPPNANARPR
ncbi:hypothetical protein, partial [Ottowia flava]|uniref:hypothetical protein n=1 Tax=Ottowia sp. GY511 TaxID=2603274 RepID=UPI001C9C8928